MTLGILLDLPNTYIVFVRDNGDSPTKPSSRDRTIFRYNNWTPCGRVEYQMSCFFPFMVGSDGRGKSNYRCTSDSRRGFYIVRVYGRPRGQSLISVRNPYYFGSSLHPSTHLWSTPKTTTPAVVHRLHRTPHFGRPPPQRPRAIRAGPFINLTKEYRRRRPVVAESTSICLLLNPYVYQAKHSSIYTMDVMSNVYVRFFSTKQGWFLHLCRTINLRKLSEVHVCVCVPSSSNAKSAK